jgi:hypothetical protein
MEARYDEAKRILFKRRSVGKGLSSGDMRCRGPKGFVASFTTQLDSL